MSTTTPPRALIKSMRGSDPDAAVYWLARMLEAGEDPRFIARRIAILASEDIGNADPQAILVAAAAYDIVERIGMPECQLTLAQAAIYMATAPKSNASAMAIWSAMDDVKRRPHHARAQAPARYATTKARSGSATARATSTPTTTPTGIVAQDYLGVDKTYYTPTDRGYEATIAQRLAKWKALKAQQQTAGQSASRRK